MSRKRRSLAPFAFCSIVFILAAAFCVGYVSVYQANNPQIRQFDVDMAYSKGYSDGYYAALTALTPTPKPKPTPAPTQRSASPSIDSRIGDYVNRTSPPSSSSASSFTDYINEKIAEANAKAGSFDQYVRERSSATAAPAPRNAYAYIGNRNSMIFHYPSCSSVGQMKDSNKVYLDSRSEAIDRGYRACKRCDP